jgi:hypothetical protein
MLIGRAYVASPPRPRSATPSPPCPQPTAEAGSGQPCGPTPQRALWRGLGPIRSGRTGSGRRSRSMVSSSQSSSGLVRVAVAHPDITSGVMLDTPG